MKQLEDRLLIEIRNRQRKKCPIKDHTTVLTAKQDDLHGFGLATIAVSSKNMTADYGWTAPTTPLP